MTLLYTTTPQSRLVLGAQQPGPRLDFPVSRDLFIAVQELVEQGDGEALDFLSRILGVALLPLGPVTEPAEDDLWRHETPGWGGEQLYEP